MIVQTKYIVATATFATIVSILVATMLPIMVPYTADGISYEDVADQRQQLSEFTGQSMLNQAPFQLKGVYTPYVAGQSVVSENSFTPDGWLAGASVPDYPYLGQVKNIRLDPSQKSDTILSQSEDRVSYEKLRWWADGDLSDWVDNIWDAISPLTYWDVLTGNTTKTITKDANYWQYSGYRYVFQPSIAVNTSVDATKQMTLSIVWYQYLNTEGISGGLVVYNENDRVLLANYTMQEIIGDYNVNSGYASVYTLNFDGVPVSMAIRFDQNVLDGSTPLESAWKNGQWTCAFYAKSVSTLLDKDSGSFDVNVGSIVDTYSKILTISYPDLGSPWNIILWLLCTLPLTAVLLEVMLAILDVLMPKLLPF